MPIGVPISDGEDREDQAAENRIEQAAARTGRRRHLREHRERQAAEALPQQRAENQHQPAQAEDRCGERQRRRDDVACGGGRNSVRPGFISGMASPDPAFDAHQHVTRDGKHDEGNDEQDQTERDQRGGVEIADRLGELVGDRGGDGGAGRQHRGRDSCALPMTKVTAMVSPSARPRPSMTPPMTPTRA